MSDSIESSSAEVRSAKIGANASVIVAFITAIGAAVAAFISLQKSTDAQTSAASAPIVFERHDESTVSPPFGTTDNWEIALIPQFDAKAPGSRHFAFYRTEIAAEPNENRSAWDIKAKYFYRSGKDNNEEDANGGDVVVLLWPKT